MSVYVYVWCRGAFVPKRCLVSVTFYYVAELLLEKLLDSSGTPAVPSKSRGKPTGTTSCFSHSAPERQLWAQRNLNLHRVFRSYLVI